MWYTVNMVEITRTSQVRIDLPAETALALVRAWTDACNFISETAFTNGRMSNAVTLHKLIYATVRERFGLSAQVTGSAIRQVAAKYATARTIKRELRKPVFFRDNAVVLQGGERGRDVRFTPNGVSLTALDGRIKSIPFRGEPKLAEYLKDWRFGDARLFVRKGKVYLSASFKRDVPEITTPNNAVAGVDRGINYLAVITDGSKQQFFGGGHVKHVHDRYRFKRASLQRKKAQKNTRSVRRVLRRLRGREARFQRDVNHVVSKRIVQFARDTGNPTLAVEALTGIRERSVKMRKAQRRAINGWAFYQLQTFLEYKAESFGFQVIEVDPAHTSQGCSRCGHTERANRSGHRFLCKACQYQLHSDLNGARNIRLRGILARQALDGDGVLSVTPEARTSDSSGVTGKPLALAGGH